MCDMRIEQQMTTVEAHIWGPDQRTRIAVGKDTGGILLDHAQWFRLCNIVVSIVCAIHIVVSHIGGNKSSQMG